ncbi:MAG: TVP38/TMEM64 family protein [bacterium]|nr:TVP38/TMEM64 family protein [bacterium]
MNNQANGDADEKNADPENSKSPASLAIKVVVGLLVFILIGGVWWYYWANAPEDKSLLDVLGEQESTLLQWRDDYYAATLIAAFLIYVVVTAFSLPGAAIMTILCGWLFGFWVGLPLVSFASSIGATLAFLLSRYLFGDWVKEKFSERISGFNAALEKEGPFFLFSLRLIPAVPFFVINVAMAMTPMRVATFYWVSQIGMLAGTIVFVFAGASAPRLSEIQNKGILNWQMIVAFVLLAVFPFAARWLMSWFRSDPPSEAMQTEETKSDL